MIVLVMGVSGAGKSSVGAALARALDWRFLDADDFHPPANVARMAAGIALGDEDRWPWLDRIHGELERIEASGGSAVLACSALKQAYRQRLSRGLASVKTVYLHGSYELIHARAATRVHRYMPAALLQSQFDALEPPQDAIAVDVARPPQECLARILGALGRGA